MTTSRSDDKQCAAEAAVADITDGMRIGIGTGSTVAFAIAALARRVAAGLRIEAFATSEATAIAAADSGIVVHDFARVAYIDLAIDGADEIDDRFFAIKGAGGAMLREKVVASAARRMIVIADGSKRVDAIGAVPVPVEVLPLARTLVADRITSLGGTAILRTRDKGAVITDNGNLILDCRFSAIPDPRALATALAAIPGALGHGLFLDEVDTAYIATAGVVTRLERARSTG